MCRPTVKQTGPNLKSRDNTVAEDAYDWGLIRRIAQRDQKAFEALYRRHYDYLYRFIYQITRRLDGIEEVINEVMFVVWEKAATAEPRALASTWILAIAHRKALKSLSRSGAAVESVEDDDPRFSDSGEAVAALETENLLFSALKHLSPEQRAVLELVYYHGLHYSDIATILDCPENTVKTRIFHARRKLRTVWPALTGGSTIRDNEA